MSKKCMAFRGNDEDKIPIPLPEISVGHCARYVSLGEVIAHLATKTKDLNKFLIFILKL